MKTKNYLLTFSIFLSLIIFSSVFAQTAKDNIFGDVEKKINEAREQGAALLSPEFFSKAEESFRTANEYYTNNESTRDVREKLAEAQDYCNRAFEVINLAKITLKDPVKARQDAVQVEANKYAAELFKEAEDLLYDAATEVEGGDIDDARDSGSEAEKFYRQAELKSIKDNILGEARRLVNQAREQECEEISPNTFNYALNLLNETEDLLTNNRYAKEEAIEKAEECEYQALHTMFLTKNINVLKDDDRNWEKVMLEFEDVLTGFSAQLNEAPRYENGINDAVTMIQTRITDLLNDNDQMRAEIAKLQEDYDLVSEEATTSSAQLAEKREREAKIVKVKSFFAPAEAKVTYDGDNLVIRLHGLNFPTGKSIIQPEFFSLLSKVQESIKIFPDKHILLEGHTDSKGNFNTNKRLSEERASAVREYIIANMNLKREQITSVGYGSERPVASNKTNEGRAQNRRIDVVIDLSQ